MAAAVADEGSSVDYAQAYHLQTISAGAMALLAIECWPRDWMACLHLFLETDSFAYLFSGFLARRLASFRASAPG